MYSDKQRDSQEGSQMKMQHKGRRDKKKEEEEGGGRACPAKQWDSSLAGALGDVSR